MFLFPPKKVGNAETTKMDHLRMYTFPKENCGSALECVVFSVQSVFSECSLFLGNEVGEPPGQLPFSTGEEQTFSECIIP